MKLSTLIENAQQILDDWGDLDCHMCTEETDGLRHIEQTGVEIQEGTTIKRFVLCDIEWDAPYLKIVK